MMEVIFDIYHTREQMSMTIKDIARYLIYNSYIEISNVSVEQFSELSELMEKFGFTVESSQEIIFNGSVVVPGLLTLRPTGLAANI